MTSYANSNNFFVLTFILERNSFWFLLGILQDNIVFQLEKLNKLLIDAFCLKGRRNLPAALLQALLQILRLECYMASLMEIWFHSFSLIFLLPSKTCMIKYRSMCCRI